MTGRMAMVSFIQAMFDHDVAYCVNNCHTLRTLLVVWVLLIAMIKTQIFMLLATS